MTPHLLYHAQSERSLLNNVFRYASPAWGALIREARELYERGELTELYDDDLDVLEGDVAKLAEFNGETVMLEVPEYDWNREVWRVYVRDERYRVVLVDLPRYTFEVYGSPKL